MKDYYKNQRDRTAIWHRCGHLRYYEKLGILKPRRIQRLRLYNLKDMYKLNVIRDLRRLDFSMQQIKDYLEGQTWTTLALLRQEQAWSRPKSRSCKQGPPAPKADRHPDGGPGALSPAPSPPHPPPAPCVQFSAHITRDEEMDFVMKKLIESMRTKSGTSATRPSGRFWPWMN